MASKIVTVTTNTAVDYVIEVDQLVLGGNLLATHNQQFPSGKGVNVARTIESLNCPVHVLGFVGEQSIGLFNRLQTQLLLTNFVQVSGQTRTNLTIFDQSSHAETHIRTTGFTVTPAYCKQLHNQIEALLAPDDILILSGSLPPGAPADFYAELIELAHRKSASSILDSSGESFRQGLQARPNLVKPNQIELEEFAGNPLLQEQDIVHAAYDLLKLGSEMVIVSRGAQGLLIVADNNIILKAYVNNLPHKIVTTIGCGDALVGGLAVAKLRQFTLLESIKLALSCATANLFSIEPGRFDQVQLSEISEHVVIRSL